MYEVQVDDYHMARELTDASGEHTGRWYYSCQHGDRLWPIGYCSPACHHRTREEAEQHYREYLLDQATYDGHWLGVEYRCEVCGAWTDRFAQTRAFAIHRLCRAHLNREGLSKCLVDLPRE